MARDVLLATGTARAYGAAALVSCAEDAEVVVAAERWIVHRSFSLLGGEAGEQSGIGMELLRAAVKLL